MTGAYIGLIFHRYTDIGYIEFWCPNSIMVPQMTIHCLEILFYFVQETEAYSEPCQKSKVKLHF